MLAHGGSPTQSSKSLKSFAANNCVTSSGYATRAQSQTPNSTKDAKRQSLRTSSAEHVGVCSDTSYVWPTKYQRNMPPGSTSTKRRVHLEDGRAPQSQQSLTTTSNWPNYKPITNNLPFVICLLNSKTTTT